MTSNSDPNAAIHASLSGQQMTFSTPNIGNPNDGDKPTFALLFLPVDLVVRFLELLLRTDIINPWLPNTHPTSPHFDYGWRDDLQPGLQLLKTCRTIRRLGLKILYEQNALRFTREVMGVPGHIHFSGNVRDFLAREVHVYDKHLQRHLVPIGRLIKKVIVQESDNDTDQHALLRRGKTLPPELDKAKVDFMLCVLQCLKNSGCFLTSVTITLDADILGTASHIIQPTHSRPLTTGQSLPTPTFQENPYASEMERRLGLWNEFREIRNPPATLDHSISVLNVRGTTSPAEASRQMVSFPATTAVALETWIRNVRITVGDIRYSERFNKRMVRDNGTVVPWDEWASRIPLPFTKDPYSDVESPDAHWDETKSMVDM